MFKTKKLVLIVIAMTLILLPGIISGQVFSVKSHSQNDGIYKISYSTVELDSSRLYYIFIRASLAGSESFVLKAIGGEKENIRGGDGDKTILWSPLMEGKQPDDYSFEIIAIESALVNAKLEGGNLDYRSGLGKVRIDCNLSDAVIRLEEIELKNYEEYFLPEGTYRFTAERDGFKAVSQTVFVKRDTVFVTQLNFSAAFIKVRTNVKKKEIEKIERRNRYRDFYTGYDSQALIVGKKNIVPVGKHIVLIELKDSIVMDKTVTLSKDECKTIHFNFDYKDMPDYEWTKEIRSTIYRFFNELQFGVFANKSFNGSSISMPFFYVERRLPPGHGLYATVNFGFMESFGINKITYYEKPRLLPFADVINVGAGIGYSSSNLYNLAAGIKVGGYVQEPTGYFSYYDGWNTVKYDGNIGSIYIDADLVLSKYLKKKKSYDVKIRYRFVDIIGPMQPTYKPIQNKTIMVRLGYCYKEILNLDW